jgi:hypothetical protein
MSASEEAIDYEAQRAAALTEAYRRAQADEVTRKAREASGNVIAKEKPFEKVVAALRRSSRYIKIRIVRRKAASIQHRPKRTTEVQVGHGDMIVHSRRSSGPVTRQQARMSLHARGTQGETSCCLFLG